MYKEEIVLSYWVKLSSWDNFKHIDFVGDILSERTGFEVESNYEWIAQDEIEITYKSPNGVLYYHYDGGFGVEEVTVYTLTSELLDDIRTAFEIKYNTKFRCELDEIKDDRYNINMVRINFIECSD